MSDPLVEGSDTALATRHDVALLDLDGVLYVGPDAVPGAPEAVIAAAAAGLRPAYVTNNASRTPEAVAAHLRTLGLPARAEDVVTSAQAAATLVAERVAPGSAVLVVGGEGLEAALRERGLEPVRQAGPQVTAVVQGYDPEVGWRQLAEGSYAVATGVPWVASNLDATIPTPRGIAPGNGTLVCVVARAAGRGPDAVAGKPEIALHQESVRRTGARRPLVVGDRLDTDIEGAVRAGVPSLLVLSGVSRPADLLSAGPERRPTYLAGGLADGLLKPHPPVVPAGAGWCCRGWTVTAEGAGVRVAGSGEPVDGLRALCVAWWGAADRLSGVDPAPALAAVGW